MESGVDRYLRGKSDERPVEISTAFITSFYNTNKEKKVFRTLEKHFFLCVAEELFTNTEFLNKSSVFSNVFLRQISQQSLSLTN